MFPLLRGGDHDNDYVENMLFRIRQLGTYVRVVAAPWWRARARWQTVWPGVWEVTRVLKDARRALHARRLAEAISARRNRVQAHGPGQAATLGADRELRARPRIEYREARQWTRREEEEGTARRAARRGPVGAEVGPVMLRKIDGRLPMVGDARWRREGVG